MRVERWRRLPTDERAAVDQLLDEVEAADGYPPLSDQMRLDLAATSSPPAGDAAEQHPGGVIAVLARSGATTSPSRARGELVGCAFLRPDAGDDTVAGLGTARPAWTVEVAVPPSWRSDGTVLRGLVDAARSKLARRGGGTVRLWLRAPDPASEAAIGEGFHPLRDVFQLRAPLPLRVGDRSGDRGGPEIDVRPFRPGTDEAAWLAVNNRAFAGHPEQGSWKLEDVLRREREPWFDPEGFLLHEVGGRLAGYCWTKVHRRPSLGEIYVIGVDPDFQHKGLGRALTIAGLRHLAGRAIPTGMLYVEATNEPALALYHSLGFDLHHLDRCYVTDVDGGAQTAAAAPD